MIACSTRRHALLWTWGLLLAATGVGSGFAAEASGTVELINNQPFPIRMPVRIRAAGNAISGDIGQRVGDDIVLVADIAAGARVRVSGKTNTPAKLAVSPAAGGVQLQYAGRELGRLSWDLVVRPAKAAADDASGSAAPDFAGGFTALPLAFTRTATGPVCDVWSAEALKAGLRLRIELLAFHDGFLDLEARVTNESAPQQTGVYAAVVARWEQPAVVARVLCDDNHVRPLGAADWSTFRRGEGRHLYAQRGVDWVTTTFRDGSGAAAWLHDFAASFTVLDATSKNTFRQSRYFGANVPQLGQEVQTAGNALYAVTEIARSNIRSYRDRLAENTLPARGEGVSFSSRVMLSSAAWREPDVDHAFVGYTSYNEQRRTPAGIEVSFGVASVRFGTAYFPYSTFGENFDVVKVPGMDRDAFWPLAAGVVEHWRDFADDIRRDVRLIKSFGFQVVRLHHLELLAAIPAEVRREFLDFLFGELRHVGLRAMLDVYASPTAIADLVARYADVVEAVELENEILIWGIPLDRPEQWRATYEAVKKVAPHVRVNLTGYTNTGIFTRLDALHVPYDRVGLHSYVDSLEALPSARGFALALGSFATKAGKPPVVTEWNWRGLTRLTPEARAAVYPQIFDNALATRAIPEIHQFQFQETLSPNPRVGRGNILRHYEFVHLSRRPKLEAFELLKLIRKYAAADDPVRWLEVSPSILSLTAEGRGKGTVTLTNRGPTPLRVQCGADVSASGSIWVANGPREIAAGESARCEVNVAIMDPGPGFYHGFLRIESNGKLLSYAAIEARLAGRPKLDVTTAPPADVAYPQGVAQALALDFAAPCAVVYGQDAPALEVETAIAIAETLESATGAPVGVLQHDDAIEARRTARTLILVGTARGDPQIAALAPAGKLRGGFVASRSAAGGASTLVISGANSEAVEHAGMDFLLRYWKLAKDSAARRLGVEKKELPRGLDPAQLP